MKKIFLVLFFFVFIVGCVNINNIKKTNIPSCNMPNTSNLKNLSDISILAMKSYIETCNLNFDEAKKNLKKIEKLIIERKEITKQFDESYELFINNKCSIFRNPYMFQPEEILSMAIKDKQKLHKELYEIENLELIIKAKKLLQDYKNIHDFYQKEGRVRVVEDEVEIKVIMRTSNTVKIQIANMSLTKIKKINMAYCKKYLNSIGGEECAWISNVRAVDQYGNKYDVSGKELPIFKNLLPSQLIEVNIITGLTVDGSKLNLIFDSYSVGINKPLEFNIPALPFIPSLPL